MRVPGAIYIDSNGNTHLAIYNFHRDLHIKLPTALGDTKYQAHVHYEKGSKEGGISIFTMPLNSHHLTKFIDIKKRFRVGGKNVFLGAYLNDQKYITPGTTHQAKYQFNIGGETSTGNRFLDQELFAIASADIANFCEDDWAKIGQETQFHPVDEIIPKTKIKRINYSWMVTPGKQEFIPQCILVGNIDFSKGCITGWRPGKNPGFDGEIFTDYWLYPWGECAYCYALRQHKSFPKTIFNLDPKQLREELNGAARLIYDETKKMYVPLGHKVPVLRIGKRTEGYTPFTEEQLFQTLEVAGDLEIKTVMPTKRMPYRKDLERALKYGNTAILFSFSFPQAEESVEYFGNTNEWKLDQARQYRKSGVNANIYLQVNGHEPFGKREKKVLEFSKRHNIPIQILPMRYPNKQVCSLLTNAPWDVLKDTQSRANMSFDSIRTSPFAGTYLAENGNSLLLEHIHPDILAAVGNNQGRVRICHHTSQEAYCGGCGHTKGSVSQRRNPQIKRAIKKPDKKQKSPIKNGDLFKT